MEIKKFSYPKKDGSFQDRRVLVVQKYKGFFDSIDLEKLSNEEQEILIKHMEYHEMFMKPYIEKAFRRFSKEKIKEYSFLEQK